jgi:hypothetical protein
MRTLLLSCNHLFSLVSPLIIPGRHFQLRTFHTLFISNFWSSLFRGPVKYGTVSQSVSLSSDVILQFPPYRKHTCSVLTRVGCFSLSVFTEGESSLPLSVHSIGEVLPFFHQSQTMFFCFLLREASLAILCNLFQN